MELPQEPGSRWYGDWVRGLDAWLCWRVVPDGLLGRGRPRMVVLWKCPLRNARESRARGASRRAA